MVDVLEFKKKSKESGIVTLANPYSPELVPD
jgi:hypothetical protein